MKLSNMYIYMICALMTFSNGLSLARRGGGRGGMRGVGGRGRPGGPRARGGSMRVRPWRGTHSRWRGYHPRHRLRYGPRVWWSSSPYWRSNYYWDPYCTIWDPTNPYCYY